MKVLYAHFCSEIMDTLKRHEESIVLNFCEKKLDKVLFTAPYELYEGNKTVKLKTVLGVSWNGKEGECVLVNSDGDYVEHFSFTYRRFNSLIREFLKKNHVSLIAVGTCVYSSRNLFRDVISVLQDMRVKSREKISHCTWVDSEAAEIYSTSPQAAEEYEELFPEEQFNRLIMEALSTARQALDPLTEISKLCNPSRDICLLNLHPLQKQIPQESLFARLERAVINNVNAVGVNIFELVRNPHTAHLLSFISGFDHVRATDFIYRIASLRPIISSKIELANFLPGKIARNALGFFFLSRDKLSDSRSLEYKDASRSNSNETMLARTRVLPEDYRFAIKIANDAVSDDEGIRSDCVAELLRNPEKMKFIDLGIFESILLIREEGANSKGKKHTLHDIEREYKNPFRDPRVPFQEMEFNLLFDLLTNTTSEIFHVGMMCNAILKSGILNFFF